MAARPDIHDKYQVITRLMADLHENRRKAIHEITQGKSESWKSDYETVAFTVSMIKNVGVVTAVLCAYGLGRRVFRRPVYAQIPIVWKGFCYFSLFGVFTGLSHTLIGRSQEDISNLLADDFLLEAERHRDDLESNKH